MKNTFVGSIIFLSIILVAGLYLAPFMSQMEGFTSKLLGSTDGIYPVSVDKPILDDYPIIGKMETSNNNYSDIWFNYPVLPVGSFNQITNNLRYHSNPDNGQCVRADFCGAIYNNKQNTQTNIINPLPPAEEGPGARVGYFRSEPNELYFSIPTNENILY